MSKSARQEGCAAAIVAVVAVATAAMYCWKGGGDPPPPRTYTFVVEGAAEDLPFNEVLYVLRTEDGVWQEATGVGIPEDRRIPFTATPGERWRVVSEDDPSDAMRSLFWMVDAEGEFGEGAEISVKLPPRSRVRVLAAEGSAGQDVVTVFDERTGHHGWALNEAMKGLYEAAVSAGDRRSFQRRARYRPYVCDTFRPKACVLGVKVENRQWWVRRVELAPGGVLDVDMKTQPQGGGEVVCEEGKAILLVNGDLPLPPARPRTDFAYRARWQNVPPGKHAVRYPDGRERTFELRDGETVTMPKQP